MSSFLLGRSVAELHREELFGCWLISLIWVACAVTGAAVGVYSLTERDERDLRLLNFAKIMVFSRRRGCLYNYGLRFVSSYLP